MKSRIVIIGIFLLACFVSCEKTVSDILIDQKEPEYCVNYQDSGLKKILLSEQELNIAKSLFEANHIDYSQLQFYRFKADDLGYHHVRCYQYVNGFRIFNNDVIFHFNTKGIHYSTSGELIHRIIADTLFSMPADSVIGIFLKRMGEDSWFSGRVEELRQGCFYLQPGYFNLNSTASSEHMNFPKAWQVICKDHRFPFAYIDDQTSKVLYYDNGVRE